MDKEVFRDNSPADQLDGTEEVHERRNIDGASMSVHRPISISLTSASRIPGYDSSSPAVEPCYRDFTP